MPRPRSFFVQFNWSRLVPTKHGPNTGTTVIGIDAVDGDAAKAEAKLRFTDKRLKFTCVRPFTSH